MDRFDKLPLDQSANRLPGDTQRLIVCQQEEPKIDVADVKTQISLTECSSQALLINIIITPTSDTMEKNLSSTFSLEGTPLTDSE